MIPNRRTAPVLAVSLVALVATAAGCAGRDSGASTASPVGSASPTASPAATAVTPTATVSTAPTRPVAKAGCPVDATTLEGAFHANPEIAHAIILGSGLSDITCYMDYATARTNPVNMDRAMVLFAYEPDGGTWNAISGGTDLDCRRAPATVISHLPGCHNQ